MIMLYTDTRLIRKQRVKMKRIVVYFIFFSVCTTAVFAQLWPKGELKQTDWNISLKKIKVGDVLEQEYYSCFGGKYDTAWCEEVDGDGIGEVVIALFQDDGYRRKKTCIKRYKRLAKA